MANTEAVVGGAIKLTTTAAERPPASFQSPSPVSVSQDSFQNTDVCSCQGMPVQAVDLSMSSTLSALISVILTVMALKAFLL